MQRVVQSRQLWLSALFIISFLLSPNLAAAQSAGNPPPADDSAQLALFLPFASNDTPRSQPDSNPITIAVAADSSRAVTQTIPVEGGTISVTAANGARYTLTIPADALLSDEEIVMMPLAAATDIPMSAGLVAGVHLLPDGLRLIRSATLTIEGAPNIDPALQVAGFGYQEDGKEFHLRPITTGDAGYSLKLNHFSGYGVTAGTVTEIQTQTTQHAPTGRDDAMQQKLYEEIGSPEELAAHYESILEFELLPARSGDERALNRALSYFPLWYEMVQEVGLENNPAFVEMISTGWKHLLLALASTIELSYVACKEGDASQVVKVLRWSRIMRMLPVEQRRVWVQDSYINNTMTKMARGCATFELDFDSTVLQDVPGVPPHGQAHDSHVRAEKIRVQFDLNTKLVAPSQAPLVYQSFNIIGTVSKCAPSTQTTNGTFNLIDGRINLNYNWGEKPKLSLIFDPGHPTETITHHCPSNVVLVHEPTFWNTGFWVLHWTELYGDTLTFDFKSWRFVGTSLYAELIIERPAIAERNYIHGTTWMVLAHAPE